MTLTERQLDALEQIFELDRTLAPVATACLSVIAETRRYRTEHPEIEQKAAHWERSAHAAVAGWEEYEEITEARLTRLREARDTLAKIALSFTTPFDTVERARIEILCKVDENDGRPAI